MDFKKLLPISLLTVGLLLTGCGPKGPSIPAENEDGHHTIEVTNLESLQAKWWSGSVRTLELSIATDGTAGNVTAELLADNLKVYSSDEGVIKADGLSLNALKGGETTVAIKYYDTVKQIKFTVDQVLTAKDLTGHEGTLEDPLDNEGALTLAKWQKENTGFDGKDYYFKGIVKSFYHSPGSRSDKTCSWFLTPAEAGGEKFEVYKCVILDENGKSRQWTADDIWKGAEVVAHGPLAEYQGQFETSASTLDSVKGQKPGPAQTITGKTFAEVLEMGKALDDGDSTYDKYVVEGYVVKQAAAKEHYLAATNQAAEDNKAMIELYGGQDAEIAKLLKGAKVRVTLNVKNYHGQVENDGDFTVEVVEPGKPWVIPEIEATVAEALVVAKALADGATSEELYIVTGVVVAVTGAWSSQYGNMSFTIGATADATETITVFRLKCSEADAAAVVAGAEVIVKGNLQNFVKNEEHTYELVNGVLVPKGGETITIELADFEEAAAGAVTQTVKGVKFECSNGTVVKTNSTEANNNFRVYKNATLKISVASGKMVKIQMTFMAAGTSQYGAGLIALNEGENGSYTTADKVGTWTGDAAAVTLNANAGQARFIKVVVTLAA